MRKLAIGVLTLGVLLAAGALRVADLWFARAETLRVAEARAANLAGILSEYLGESFAAADAALRQLVLHSARVGGPAAPAREWTPSLASARAGLTGVGAITVVDRDLIVRHSTRTDIIGESRASDPVFRRALGAEDDELLVGTPFHPPAGPPGAYILPIGRRLTGRDGAADGVVVASFLPGAPRAFFRTVDVGERGTVWVFHPEGIVLFREPSAADPMGGAAQGNAIFAAARSAATGTLRGQVDGDGPVLISAFHTADAAPLIVAVSLDRDEVLAHWRGEVVGSAVIFGVLALTLAATLGVLYRQMDERAAAEAALTRARRLEAERLRDANEKLEAALEREQAARRDAEAASALKDQFLMTVSHELRTPLTAIHGWARMLAEGAVSEARRVDALRSIERNAFAQTRLIDDLLDVSRATSGKLRLDLRPVQVADVLRGAVDTVIAAAQAKEIAVETSVDDSAGVIEADPDRLQQIVWNLLSNAVKFTPNGGRVRVSAAREGQTLQIEVADTGAGISPEFLPHVFERFRQEDGGTTRHFGGLGIGLAIVRHLVELHGGSVSASSDGPGRGATFVVRLPARAAPAAGVSPAPRARERHAVAYEGALDGLRVLVVEDDPEARDLFSTILQVAGAHVDCASSASEALEALAASSYDVLISDIEMPGADGYGLVSRALAIAAARGDRMGAVAVTAYSRPEDEARSLAAGFHCHLRKPVDPATLVGVVRDTGRGGLFTDVR